jgi:ubiquinone biosynthesis protein
MDWNVLIDESVLASVLPDEYARFARPVAGALAVFLEGLPAAHQEAVLADQAALAPSATPEERLAALARSCPALHKLGQILARDRRLSPELRRHLQDLESLPPSVPAETIQDILTGELGPLDRLGVTLLPPALAEASVAVVIPFRQVSPPREGVFKVLKPGIEERLEQELELLEGVGAYLDQRCEESGLPPLDYREAFQQVRDKLRHEYRLDLEQRHLTLARALYEGEPRVQVPALYEYCTRRVTAMERVTGGKVTEHDLAGAGDRRRLARLVVEALIARPVFARAGAALFHADPHAGNLFLTADGRLAVLDWSLVGWLGESERTAMVQVLLGALTLDAERIVAVLEQLAGRRRADRPALKGVVRARLARVRQGQVPGFTWLMGLLDEAVQTARLRVGADLLLFRKSLYTLEGVVADIGAGESRIDEVLLSEFLAHFIVEWPGRWLAPPNARGFATRLSNVDLLRLLLSWPSTMARFWLDPGAVAPEHGIAYPGRDGNPVQDGHKLATNSPEKGP